MSRSAGLSAVNYKRLIITNLPPLLVVLNRARDLPLVIGWRVTPHLICCPGRRAREEAEGK